MNIYQPEFKPTYLCIKQHSVTGLKYLCKTTRSYKKMLTYSGSGRYWKDHLKIHGKDQFETVWFCLFYDKDELVKFSLMCSEQWDIVGVKDTTGQKIWANLRPEDGLAGGSIPGYMIQPEELRLRRSILMRGVGKGKLNPHTEEHKEALRKPKKNTKNYKKPKSDKHAANIAKARIDKPQKKVKCPYCSKVGGCQVMKRWHFDRCPNLL